MRKISFEAYNESEVHKDVISRYYQRKGHYPEGVIVDKNYQNKTNLQINVFKPPG